jgi:hypothetical protein
MSRNESRHIDEQSVARAFHDKMRGLNAFIPPAPPYSQIEPGTRAVAAGTRASGGRVHSGRRAAVALLMVAAVVILAVAVVLVPRAIVPAAASPSGSPAGPVPSPSAAVPTPQPTLSGTVIYLGSGTDIAWSPIGTEVVSADSDGVHVIAAGNWSGVLDSLPGYRAEWLDGATLAVLQYDGQAYVADLGNVTDLASGTRSPIAGQYSDMIGGSGGQVALQLKEQGKDEYRIWSKSAGLSAIRDGLVVAFSPDGKKLAVVHNPEPCCMGGSPSPYPATLDVTDVATGNSLATDRQIMSSGTLGYRAVFSPDSRWIAFLRQDPQNKNLAGAGVLDVDTARLWEVQPGSKDVAEEYQEFFWRDSGHLEILPWTSGAAPSDMPVVVSYGGGAISAAAASSNGYVATTASTIDQWGGLAGSTSVTVTGGGSSRKVDLPAYAFELYWSPDGSMLLINCGPQDTGAGDWYLVLVRI